MSEPLLSSRRSSSSDDDAEDALLQRANRRLDRKHERRELWTKLGLGIWAGLATVAVVVLAVVFAKTRSRGEKEDSFPPSGKRNVIFMVSDGMGPTSLELTRAYRQFTQGLPWDETLTLDKHLIGTSRTRSTSSLVTDSAAGATAFSCGLKSYNGAISVLPDGSPCGTVLEAAKRAGYMTGLVVTTRITDATPACFSAHVNMRSEEDRIAEQQLGDYPLGRVVDLLLGGGRCHFLPNTTEGGCRADSRDLIKEAQEERGFSYIGSRAQFDALEGGNAVKLPLLGLFAETDIPFELDRDDSVYPSLSEMAMTALTALTAATKDSDQGFFLMIEGSRIDHAGHGNDPVAQVHEVLAYDRAFATALDWVENQPNAVLVSTSDHETGGLAAARQLHSAYPDYLWYPGVLANASHSAEHLGLMYRKYGEFSDEGVDEKAWVREILLRQGLGIEDAEEWEIAHIMSERGYADHVLADCISRRAQVGWSTHGHSGVDVNIYGSGAAARRLGGNHENTEVGEFIRDYLQLDVAGVTEELKKEGVGRVHATKEGESHEHVEYAWMGRTLQELGNEGLDVDHLDCYHGEFKH